MVRFKAGVVVYRMHPEVERIIDVLDDISKRVARRDVVITSAREGEHSKNSLHYKGRALDIRVNDLDANTRALYLRAIKNALDDAKWDVVDEGTHIHIEFDPR